MGRADSSLEGYYIELSPIVRSKISAPSFSWIRCPRVSLFDSIDIHAERWSSNFMFSKAKGLFASISQSRKSSNSPKIYVNRGDGSMRGDADTYFTTDVGQELLKRIQRMDLMGSDPVRPFRRAARPRRTRRPRASKP